jgi:hypothetical protein
MQVLDRATRVVKTQEVPVAILDTGIDSDHEDLLNVVTKKPILPENLRFDDFRDTVHILSGLSLLIATTR